MSPVPPDLYKGADPTGATATLLLIGMVCEEPAPVELFWAYIPVVPPEDERVEGVYYHALALPCVADPATAEAMATWNVPCFEGQITVDAETETPAGAAWGMVVDREAASATLDGTAPGSRTETGPEHVRAFHAVGAEVCAVTDVRVEVHEHWQFGAATVDTGERPWFPPPGGPGLASLGQPGFGMTITHVEDTGLEAPSLPCA